MFIEVEIKEIKCCNVGAHVNKSRYKKELNKVDSHFTFSCTLFLDIPNARLSTKTKDCKMGIFMVSTSTNING